MKTFWTFFIFSVACTLLGTIFFESGIRKAVATDERVQNMDSSGIRASKVTVPTTESMESALKDKQEEITQKERKLKQTEEHLKSQEEHVKAELEELLKAKEEFSSKVEEKKQKDEQSLSRMVKTFESMDLKKAANIVMIMEESLAVDILTRMKEKKAALLLANMEANKAMILSSLMSRRKPAQASQASEGAKNLEKKGGEKNE